MKTNRILVAALALITLASCNKQSLEEEAPAFNGEKSYLTVKIAQTNAGTKATGDDTNPFYYGTADEQAVVSATFFFYNADGSYNTVVSRSIYEERAETSGQGNKNVEWIGKGVVLLTNVSAKPKYMAVVLNADDALINALTGKSSTDAEAVLTTKIATQDATAGTWTNFVMTSSSYVNGNTAGYYLNTLQDSDFKSTEAEALASTSPVEVYVERLAVKIELKLNNTTSTNQYKIGKTTIDGADKDLYAKIDNWGLNATTRNTYGYKLIDPSWTLSFNGSSWSDPTNFRTYWGKSTNYDITTYYPDSFGNSTDSRNYDGTKEILDYVSYNELAVATGSAAYCRENTNDPASFDATEPLNYNSTFTSILLKATLVDDAGAALNVINYKGQLFTVDGYKARILEYCKSLDADKYIPWKAGSAAGTYVQVSADDFETPVDLHDGYTGLEFKDGTYYQKNGTSYDALTAEEATKMLNYGDKASTETTYDNTLALYYVDGQMYYTVPVEHLNNGYKYNNIDGNTVVEGDYGVVRNHYYSVTVNSIKNLGNAVYDPDEKIIPNDKTLQKYFLSAQVNILSWKLVNQTVDL
jgi:hypothetical protein